MKSKYFYLHQLPNDIPFVKKVCEENGINKLNDGIEEFLKNCRDMTRALNLSEDQLYGMLVSGLHSLNGDGVKRLIQSVEKSVELKANEYNKPSHSTTNYHLALGIIATYFHLVITEAGYISF